MEHNCECYFVTETIDGEYMTECELTGKCPLEESDEDGGEENVYK